MKPEFEDLRKLATEKKEIKHKIEEVKGERIHIFSYMISTPELFKTPLERECRGITFDDSGKILCRPFHKFFNIGEREETLPENIIWDLITIVVPKVDGSLITPVIINDEVLWKSKKTFYSSVALMVQDAWDKGEKWVRQHEEDIWDFWSTNETPIFELTSPSNKVVIDYGKEKKLTLLASRHNFSGQYWVPPDFKDKELSKEIMKKDFSYKTFIEKTKNMENIEGFCLYSIDDKIYKIKTEWYLARHRLISELSYKNTLNMIKEETIDDLISQMRVEGLIEKVEKIEALYKEFKLLIDKHYEETEKLYEQIINSFDGEFTKKDIVMECKSRAPKQLPLVIGAYNGNLFDLAFDRAFNELLEKYKGKILL